MISTTGGTRSQALSAGLRSAMRGPGFPVIAPLVILAAYLLGGETMLIIGSLSIPALYGLTVGFGNRQGAAEDRRTDRVTGLPRREALDHILDMRMSQVRATPLVTGCFVIAIDDFADLRSKFSQSTCDALLRSMADRLRAQIRDDDLLSRIGEDRFGLAIAPVAHLDLEVAIQMAGRLQSALQDPLAMDATNLHMSASVGFCLSPQSPLASGHALAENALRAAQEASRNAPSAIRAFTETLAATPPEDAPPDLEEVVAALENGQIQPWFQPQLSTDTGRITGFEALARWTHPTRGVVPPAEFLPALEQAGKMERLGEVIMYYAFSAMRSWDDAGLDIPYIGINFASEELRNPRLLDKIAWELDRFDLGASRLSVEVLETVVSTSPDDVISRNINGLSHMGCRIDLDDFGTGNASIASIRRFAVQRIKIDRSFVMKVDRDPEQQRIVSAILTMAERLNLETLAEGVETIGEHAMLAQLGCVHVQGYGIARPMPVDKTEAWIRAHHAKIATPPALPKRQGKI